MGKDGYPVLWPAAAAWSGCVGTYGSAGKGCDLSMQEIVKTLWGQLRSAGERHHPAGGSTRHRYDWIIDTSEIPGILTRAEGGHQESAR